MILRVRGQGEVERRSFALTDMIRYGYNDLRIQGSFSERNVRGLPAINRAARLRAEAVAKLDLCVYKGSKQIRSKVDGTWQARLFRQERANECQTKFDFWETVEESLAYRGNGYIWKLVDPNTSRIVQWYALHPDQVECMGDDEYRVKTMKGYVDPIDRGPATYEVGTETILHVRGHGDGGTTEAPSPVKVFADALMPAIYRNIHQRRMWQRGAQLGIGVEFPAGVSAAQAQEWRQDFEARNEGANGSTTAVVGGGAQFKTIGMTLQDAQFVELSHLTTQDAAQIMGVPDELLMAPPRDTKIDLEQVTRLWLQFGLGPELGRIESALAADENLFPPGASTWPAFETDGFVRGDVKTEAEVLVSLVQAGILVPDEARNTRGLDDLPDGVGKVPQVTPVGGAPNPMPMPSVDSTPAESDY